MRLWRNGPDNPHVWGCGSCHADSERRRRARVRASRVDKLLGRVLTGRLHFERIQEHLRALLRACGGWGGLRDALSPADRAKLAIKLAEIAERETARVAALERRQGEAEAFLDSPTLQRDLEQMALDWIRSHPTAAVRELMETPAGKRALRRVMEQEGV